MRKGQITQIIGAVVDVKFEGELPEILTALECDNSGNRLVCVGWIESYVRSIEEREYLFDLDAGARSLLTKHGRSDELDLIFKSYSNLLRVMGD